MSKLTPLSSALVLALPLILTACGGSDGASGNNHSGSNAAPKAKNSGEHVNKQEQKFPSHVNVNDNGNSNSAHSSSTASNSQASSSNDDVSFVRGGQQFVSTNGNSSEKEVSATFGDKLLNENTSVVANKTSENANTTPREETSSRSTKRTSVTTVKTVGNATTPVTPVTPVRDVVNTTSTSPVTKVTPVEPVTKVKHNTPIESVEPVTPVTPVTPVKPVTPVEPVTRNTPQTSNSSANTTTHENQSAEDDIELSSSYASGGISTPTVEASSDSFVNAETSPVKPTAEPDNVFKFNNNKLKTFKNIVRVYDGETKGQSREDDPNLTRDIYRLTNTHVQAELDSNKSLNKDLNKDQFINIDQRYRNDFINTNGALFVNLSTVLNNNAVVEAMPNAPTKQSLTGRGVTTVIIDGSVDQYSSNFDSVPTRLSYYGDPVRSSYDIVDSDNKSKSNHGTNVGSILAGKRNNENLGFAPNARLRYILLPKNPDFYAMYNAAIKSGATVVNNSYSFSGYNNQVIDYASAKRLLEMETTNNENMPVFVFATGNQYRINGRVVDRQYNPSSVLVDFARNSQMQDSIITVTGVNVGVPKNAKTNGRRQYILNSDFFNLADTAIPCGETYYSCIAAPNSYKMYNRAANRDDINVGTSFAAPQVSGAIALVKEQFPWMNAGNLKTTVLTTAIDIGYEGVDRETGWGLLNVGRAVKGPMQFAFGDFYANLKDSTGNYYFANNIFGRGGLIVDAHSNNTTGKLILTGNNVFKGDTIVHRGTLVVTNSLKSKLVVRSNGKAIVNNSSIGETYNNGIMVAKDTIVNGNFKQGSTATLVVEPTHPLEVKGEATLAGTIKVDNVDNYVGSKRSLKTVLSAQKIKAGSYFYNKVYPNDSQVNYDIYYDYSDGLVQVDIYRKNTNDTAAILASDSANSDKDAINNGGKLLENYFSNIDFVGETNTFVTHRNYFGSNRDSSNVNRTYSYLYNKFNKYRQTVSLDSISADDLLSAASEIQAMSSDQFNDLIIKASGSSYANNFKAISLAGIDKSNRFSDAVIDRALDKDNLDSYQAYFDAEFQGKENTWKNDNSKVEGKFTDTSSNAGLIYSKNNFNLGVSVNAGSAKWSQKLNKGQDEVYANIEDKLVGTNLDLTFADDINSDTQVYIGGSLGVTHHSLKSTRNLFESKDNKKVETKADFTTNEYRSAVQAGVRYNLLSNLNLGLKARLNYSSLNTDQFKETISKEVYDHLALNHNKSSQLGYLYSTLGLNTQYSFNNFASLLLSTEWKHLISGDDNKLDTSIEGVKISSNLENNNIFSVDATFRTNITESMTFDIGAKYNFSSIAKDYSAKASLTYSF